MYTYICIIMYMYLFSLICVYMYTHVYMFIPMLYSYAHMCADVLDCETFNYRTIKITHTPDVKVRNSPGITHNEPKFEP